MAKKSAKPATAAKKQAPKPISKPVQKPPTPPALVRLQSKDGPKWSLSKLEMGQYLSMTSYMTVVNIRNDDMISVKNQHGHFM